MNARPPLSDPTTITLQTGIREEGRVYALKAGRTALGHAEGALPAAVEAAARVGAPELYDPTRHLDDALAEAAHARAQAALLQLQEEERRARAAREAADADLGRFGAAPATPARLLVGLAVALSMGALLGLGVAGAATVPLLGPLWGSLLGGVAGLGLGAAFVAGAHGAARDSELPGRPALAAGVALCALIGAATALLWLAAPLPSLVGVAAGLLQLGIGAVFCLSLARARLAWRRWEARHPEWAALRGALAAAERELSLRIRERERVEAQIEAHHAMIKQRREALHLFDQNVRSAVEAATVGQAEGAVENKAALFGRPLHTPLDVPPRLLVSASRVRTPSTPRA